MPSNAILTILAPGICEEIGEPISSAYGSSSFDIEIIDSNADFLPGNSSLPGSNSVLEAEDGDILFISDFATISSDNMEVLVVELSFEVSSPVTALIQIEDSNGEDLLDEEVSYL